MNTIIFDVCDVVGRRLSDNKIVFTGTAQTTDITSKVKEEKLYGGIGSQLVAVYQNERDIELKVQEVVFDTTYLEMAYGSDFVEGQTAIVWNKENNLTISGNALPIQGTPMTGSLIAVIDQYGRRYTGTYAAGTITVSGSIPPSVTNAGGWTALYQIQTTTANTLNLDATKFGQNFALEFHTIGHSVTNQVVADYYFQFANAQPQGNFAITLQNGKAKAPELTFTALTAPGSNSFGTFVEVPRIS